MSDSPGIETHRLRLRFLSPDDALVIQQLAGVQEVAQNTLAFNLPLTLAQAREWIAKRMDSNAEGKSVAYGVTLQASGQFIGAAGLSSIDREHSSAEMGFWMGVDWWGQGYATEAAGAVLRYGFQELKLNRVYAHHMTRNPASGRVLEKIGMQREGVLRQMIRKWGVFEDVVLYAILRQGWTG